MPEDDSVADSEVVLPHAVGEVAVRQGEDGLNITTRQSLRSLLQVPLADPTKAMVGRTIHAIVPLTKLREDEGNFSSDRFPTIKH